MASVKDSNNHADRDDGECYRRRGIRVGLPLGLKAWHCGTDVQSDDVLSTDLTFDGTPYLSLDLSQRMHDFPSRAH